MLANEIEQALMVFLSKDLLHDKNLKDWSRDQSLIESGTLRSMEVLRLVTFCEANFGIEIPDEELLPENFESVALVARLVERLVSRLRV